MVVDATDMAAAASLGFSVGVELLDDEVLGNEINDALRSAQEELMDIENNIWEENENDNANDDETDDDGEGPLEVIPEETILTEEEETPEEKSNGVKNDEEKDEDEQQPETPAMVAETELEILPMVATTVDKETPEENDSKEEGRKLETIPTVDTTTAKKEMQ